MSESDALLDAARLTRDAPRLSTGAAFAFLVKESTQSTNDDVRRLAEEGALEGTIVIAEKQAAGRGRRGNRWMAPAGKCLLLSVLLRPAVAPALWPRVTHLAALAICRAYEPLLAAPPTIKWPNDVLVGGRKLCGILLESSGSTAGRFLVLGVGINVNVATSDLPDELQSTATSLLIETGSIHDRHEMVLRFLRAFSTLFPSGIEPFDPALKEILTRSALLGKEVTLQHMDSQISGIVAGFGPNGELELMTPDGVRRLSSGELVRTGSKPL